MGFFKYKKHDQIIYMNMHMYNYPEYLMIKLIELNESLPHDHKLRIFLVKISNLHNF